MWPQAKSELLRFANHFERRGSPISAVQLRMAVQMATVEYDRLADPVNSGRRTGDFDSRTQRFHDQIAEHNEPGKDPEEES